MNKKEKLEKGIILFNTFLNKRDDLSLSLGNYVNQWYAETLKLYFNNKICDFVFREYFPISTNKCFKYTMPFIGINHDWRGYYVYRVYFKLIKNRHLPKQESIVFIEQLNDDLCNIDYKSLISPPLDFNALGKINFKFEKS